MNCNMKEVGINNGKYKYIWHDNKKGISFLSEIMDNTNDKLWKNWNIWERFTITGLV